MHWTGYVTYYAVVPWLVAGSFVSRTPLVLLGAWLLGEATWQATGNLVPIALYIFTDIASIGLIASWATGRDWLILAFYPGAWAGYLMHDKVEQWWLLLVIFWAQAFFAGPFLAPKRNRTWEGRRGLVRG